uniref:Uncharacterized protein n=1 Tax=Plectus sambesii TaxID=2011161 RepID=A0A914XB50_9BILA
MSLFWNIKLSNAASQCILGSTRCFALVTENASAWYSAEEHCESHLSSGFLASIRNAFETSYIQSLLRNSPLSTNVWIGGFRTADSPFQWTDGESFFYNQFAPGQPDPSGSCIQICSKDEPGCRLGQWKTAPCSGVMSSFFCEYVGSGSSTTAQPSSSTISSSATQSGSSSTLIHSSISPSTPLPTTIQAVPCQGNFVFLIDSSNGMTPPQFRNQTTYISSIFGATWTYTEADIAIAQYADTAIVSDPFGTITDVDSAQAAVKSANYYGDTARITAALQATSDPKIINGGQPGVSQTTILFASTSVDTDIAAAMPYANKLKAMGSLIIVAMGPNASVNKLQPLATKVLSWADFSSVPANLNSQIISAMCPT